MVRNELFKLDRIETRLLLCNRRLIRYLQVVVHRVFPHPAVKLIPFQFLLEQRVLHIVKNDTLIIKGKDFIFVSTDIHCISEMIFVLRLSPLPFNDVDFFFFFLFGRRYR